MQLLARGGLPKLDFVALRVNDPAELAELRLLDLINDVTPFAAQCRKQSVQIVDAIVDHEGRLTRFKVSRVSLERTPHGCSDAGRVVGRGPAKRSAAPFLNIDAQVRAVPFGQSLWVFRLEEDAANASHSFHIQTPFRWLFDDSRG